MRNKQINILIAGGSGLWAEKNHYSSLVTLKNEGIDVKVVAICDPINPRETEPAEIRNNLKSILDIDKPAWINPIELSHEDLLAQLDKFHKDTPLDGMIVSTNPTYHFIYCKWALTRGVNILCDKPLITASNSSFDVISARSAQKQYEELLNDYRLIKTKNPNFMFCSPLRRRALTPYMKVADGLKSVFEETGEGLRYMNVVVNGGIHKYPAEYTKGGAHGHLDGIGTLSHSSYHYIDVIAWYLTMARGKISTIEILNPYVLRVSDYLKTESFSSLKDILEGPDTELGSYEDIPPQVLKSELDFSFLLVLRDENNDKIGMISYIVNYSTYAPRIVTFDPGVTEYAHHKDGGRMSSVYFDIHQGPLQQWQIIKNDEVAKGHTIEVKHELHPKLGQKQETSIYNDAYETNTLTSKDLFKWFIKACGGQPVPEEMNNLLSTIETQNLTNRIYSLMYEKIAEEYDSSEGIEPEKSNIIKLKEYL